MNTRCTLGKPNMGKTQLEGEAYALLFSSSYEMQIQRKRHSLWSCHGHYGQYGYYKIFYFLLFYFNIPLPNALLNYGTIIIQ
jgi:hypothetical protein